MYKRILFAMMMAFVGFASVHAQAREMYVSLEELTDGSKELVFYYDNLRSTRDVCFDMNTGNQLPDWNSVSDDVEYIRFDPSFADARPTSTYRWFDGFKNVSLITGSITSLNTSNVTTMFRMFANCSSLQQVTLTNFDTTNVTDMSRMFEDCSSLTVIDFGSNFTTGNVTDMSYMFSGCESLYSGVITELKNWNTSKVTNMRGMFRGCSQMSYLDLSQWNTGMVTNMGSMFDGCSNLRNFNISGWNTERVTEMDGMFRGCSALTSLDVSGFNTSNVTQMQYMFYGCSGLTSLDVSGFNTANVTNMQSMFDGCSGLTSLDVNGFTTANVTNMQSLFSGCSGLTSLYVKYFNTGNVTDMHNMFLGCSGLRSLDLSSWNTSKVTSMKYMFKDCSAIQIVYTSNFNTASVTDMAGMFENCSLLYTADVSGFNTSNVTNMRSMFSGCRTLNIINVSAFNTSQVTDMSFMFNNCSSVMNLNVRGFNTSQVTSMRDMFSGCSNLRGLDLSGFDIRRVASVSAMFFNCENLTTILAPQDWNLGNEVSSVAMFLGCRNLRGGRGTVYDSSNADGTFAVLDLGPSHPGYFSCYYAALSDNGSTLTFYNDGNWSSHADSYFLNITYEEPGWVNSRGITKVVFDPSFADARPNSTQQWFSNQRNLATIEGLEYLHTDDVVTMAAMFSGCSSLTAIDLSGFNMQKNTSATNMFASCTALTSLDLSGMDTRNLTTMFFMFYGCTSLTSVDLSHLNTANVIDMGYMFQNCYRLTSLDLNSFNTEKVRSTQAMFSGCSALTTIYVSDLWSTSSLEYSKSLSMFDNCTSLVGGEGTVYDSSHTDKLYARVDKGTSQPGYFTLGKTSYVEIKNLTMTFYHDAFMKTHTSGTVYELNRGDELPGWSGITNLENVVFDPSFAEARPTSTNSWFKDFGRLSKIRGIEYLNTESVTNMAHMFSGCRLSALDLSHFNTENVTDMSYMFYDNYISDKLDLSGFDTHNVTDMSHMFEMNHNSYLWVIDLSSFDVSSVTTLESMFKGCQSVTGIYAGDWFRQLSSAAKLTAGDMFEGCTALWGDNGTCFSSSHIDAAYAHPDGGTDNPGYFADKEAYENGPMYAVLSEDEATLTFYYDNLRATRAGTVYSIPHTHTTPGWKNKETVTKVVFDPSFAEARPLRTYDWFFLKNNLAEIQGLQYFNTENVIDMDGMFAGCRALTSLDLSTFDTGNVTTMSDMFYSCPALANIDLSSFNTAKVTDMSGMFYYCQALETLDLSNFDTHNVTDMNNMFYYCTALKNLDLSSFNTAKVTDMSKMFYYCQALETLNLSSFDTHHVTDVSDMFYYGNNLTTIIVGAGWDMGSVTPTSRMFLGCAKLQGSAGTQYSSSHTTADYAHPDGGTDNPGYLTLAEAYAVLDGSTLTFYYDQFKGTRPGTIYDLPWSGNPGWTGTSASGITTVTFDSSFRSYSGLTSTARMFANLTALKQINHLDYLNTENVNTMLYMFYRCQALDDIDLSHFKTSKVYFMNNMFAGCSRLTGLDLSSFDTGKVTDMSYMFDNCTKLTSLDLSNFNTEHVTTMYAMFYFCKALKSLDLSGFNTANVTNMAHMFNNCNLLTSLDLTGFNTANVTNMAYMFSNCWDIKDLDLSSFNTAKVTDMSYMFNKCGSLETIYCDDDWNTGTVNGDGMFTGCYWLTGGNGTAMEEWGVTDITFAHLDTPDNPGYFTAKPAFELGDVNGDGNVNVADVTALVNIVNNVQIENGQWIMDAADVDGSGKVTSADVPALVNLILGQ